MIQASCSTICRTPTPPTTSNDEPSSAIPRAERMAASFVDPGFAAEMTIVLPPVARTHPQAMPPSDTAVAASDPASASKESSKAKLGSNPYIVSSETSARQSTSTRSPTTGGVLGDAPGDADADANGNGNGDAGGLLAGLSPGDRRGGSVGVHAATRETRTVAMTILAIRACMNDPPGSVAVNGGDRRPAPVCRTLDSPPEEARQPRDKIAHRDSR